jgi:hypothetical protein
MPQLVAIAVAGAALWAGYRWLARETRIVRDAMQAAEAELRRRAEEVMAAQTAGANDADIASAGNVDMKQLPKLELDPTSGEYRVKG